MTKTEIFSKQMNSNVLSICLLSAESLAITTEESNIFLFNLQDQSKSSFETRGESLINRLANGECFPNNNDLVGGDSEGNIVMVIDSKQVYNTKQVLPSGVTQLIYSNNRGKGEIVAGDGNGIIVSADMFFDINWRCNLSLITSAKSPSPIRCLYSAVLLDADQVPSYFILATDSRPLINFTFKGVLAVSIEVPCVVNTIVRGRFLNRPGAPPEFSLQNPEFYQLVFAGDDGMVYLLDHYETYPYADIEYYITGLKAYSTPNQSDTVLVTGHFIGCIGLRDGNQIFKIDCDDWVSEISIWKNYVALATMDEQVKVVCLD